MYLQVKLRIFSTRPNNVLSIGSNMNAKFQEYVEYKRKNRTRNKNQEVGKNENKE
jgi:hypothetical protein